MNQSRSARSWRGQRSQRGAGPPGASISPFGGLFLLQLSSSLVFGGASQENIVQTAALELLSLVLLCFALFSSPRSNLNRKPDRAPWRSAPAFLAAAILALVVVQLVPLPESLWTRLPGRAAVAHGFDLAGLRRPWLPWSLEPAATLQAGLALLPPIAIFIASYRLSEGERSLCVGAVLLLTALGLVVGALQLVSGSESHLYFYPTTNTGSPVGFFSNRNHEALLLVISLPLAAAWLSTLQDERTRSWLTAAFTAMVVIGVGIERSRAGVLLLGPGLVGEALVLLSVRHEPERRNRQVLIAGGAAMIAVLLIGTWALPPLLDRFYEARGTEFRAIAAAPIWSASTHYAPLGTGLGTFQQVYKTVEPFNLLDSEYLNHAHNDYLELWLEAGFVGAILVLGFVAVWAVATYAVWRDPAERHVMFGRAGSIAILLVLIHSALDYPLRTLAISSVFAFACGLMIRPDPRCGQMGTVKRGSVVELR